MGGKRKNLQHIILSSVAEVGLLGLAIFTPNVIRALEKTGLVSNKRQKEYIRSSASKMLKTGLLYFDGKSYKLTSRGEKRLRLWEAREFKLDRPKKWDSKWRVLIFDIPEKKKKIRNQLTALLRQAGVRRLQDSVWVYPYDCEEIITLLKTDFGIGKNLLYLEVDKLENDKYLREDFGLYDK